ncbi:uncharacterized protein TNCV_286601 [Trichonephila clavipes]|nr:uncharacterized protein TNCV_286601 [Trichonephila clavipes]
MTIATLKDLIIGSEKYAEELTKNIHSTIVDDRKAREKKQEEQEEKLRIEQLRLDEQKRKDEYELEKLRIETQYKLGADTSKESDTLYFSSKKFQNHLKRKTPLEFKEYYLDEQANMNSPVQFAEKLEEFDDIKRTLKQKSISSFVKKQEFKSTEKNRRYEAPGKFEYNRKDKKFPASTNYNKHYEAPVTKYESV